MLSCHCPLLIQVLVDVYLNWVCSYSSLNYHICVRHRKLHIHDHVIGIYHSLILYYKNSMLMLCAHVYNLSGKRESDSFVKASAEE